jgi:hypothetical protein
VEASSTTRMRVDELGDPRERRPDQPLLVVGGDDDRDALPVDHA